MTSDEQLRKLIEQAEAEQRKTIERVIELGGIPDKTEIEALYADMQTVFDQLESFWWRVGGISKCEGSDLPFPITLEQIGIVAVMADDAEERAQDFLDFARKLRRSIGTLDSIRRTQETRASSASAVSTDESN